MKIMTKMRKYLYAVIGAPVAAAAMAFSLNAASADRIVIKFPTVHGSPDAIFNRVGNKIGEELEQRLPGVFEVQVYPGSSLGDEREILEGLRLGTIEMTSSGVVGIVDPVFNVVDMPFLFRDRDHVYSVLDGPIGQEMLENLNDDRLVALGYVEAGWRHITNNVRPINSPEDVRGLRQRVAEHQVFLATMRALGANPVPIPFGELYGALRTGVVDGQDNPLSNIYTSNFYEVQRYLTLSGHVYSNNVVLVSGAFWAKLTNEQQEAIRHAVKEATIYGRKISIESEEEILQRLKDAGMIVNEIDDQEPFIEATKVVYEQFAGNYPEGLIDRIREQESNEYEYTR